MLLFDGFIADAAPLFADFVIEISSIVFGD
jgi:hypothetical protein